MDQVSEAVLALKPVTFRYKQELDPNRIPQFGLVAEEVEKVNPDLVACDAKGEVFTVRYEAVNAMLLNEFLKEHRKTQEQQVRIGDLEFAVAKQASTIAHQQESLTSQQRQLEELASAVQKVSSRLEVVKPVPRMVTNR